MGYTLSFLIGGIASYIASIFFRKYSSSKKPILKVSDVLIETDSSFKHSGNMQGYLVKLVNMTPRELLDIKIELSGIKKFNDSGSMLSSFTVCNKEYYHWESHNPDPKESSYAWQVFLPMHQGYNYKNLFEACDILYLTVTARDSYYNSFVVETKVYDKKKIKPSSCRFMNKDDIDYANDPKLEELAKFERDELTKKA